MAITRGLERHHEQNPAKLIRDTRTLVNDLLISFQVPLPSLLCLQDWLFVARY